MQAIVTKYIGPTNHFGARVKAKCQAKSVMIPWDDALDVDGNHYRAACALAINLGWTGPRYGKLVGGCMPDDTGNAYVFVKGGK